MNWYLAALKKYAVFSGRARRREYWYFTLFSTIVGVALFIVDCAMDGYRGLLPAGFFWPLSASLYGLATIVPGTAVSVRRLHDRGHTGLLLCIQVIPILGAIVLLVLMLQDSQLGDNRYGPNPKGQILSAP